MQSSDGAVHLLPALPDEFQNGKITGLRARGGFKIVSMEWQHGKVSKVVIESTIGGNLRLRVPNPMKLASGSVMKKANGKNDNPFYHQEEIPAPVISEKANVALLPLKETFLYDISTGKGKVFTLVAL